MTRAEQEREIERVRGKLARTAVGGDEAERIFRVIRRISYAQIPGEQRRSRAGRARMNALVHENVGHAIGALS